MLRQPLTPAHLQGVFPVPPLARKRDARRSLDFAANQQIVDHIRAGGIRNFLYGGNAFLYHITLAEYEALLDWMANQPADLFMIPSAGPSYGRAMDQALLLKRHAFPCVMLLPCADPRDAKGLEQGLREFADASETPLVLYMKEEHNFGANKEAGLDVAARLLSDQVCVAIKYAVVRENPREDPYLESLLRRVDRARVLSGIGERPAIVHMRDWKLPGFTTGSGCIAPALSQAIHEANASHDYETANALREVFLPFEDIRDAWGPARVLHAGAEAAGIASTGPLPPFQSELSAAELDRVRPLARALLAANRTPAAARA